MTLYRRELQPMTQSSHNLHVCPANPLYLPPPRHLCSGPLTALPAPTPPPCFSRLGSAVRMETDDLRGASTLAFHVPALPPPGHVLPFVLLTVHGFVCSLAVMPVPSFQLRDVSWSRSRGRSPSPFSSVRARFVGRIAASSHLVQLQLWVYTQTWIMGTRTKL